MFVMDIEIVKMKSAECKQYRYIKDKLCLGMGKNLYLILFFER